MKLRLLTILALSFAGALCARASEEKATSAPTTAASAQPIMLKAADLKWGDVPPALPPGAKMTVLEGDPGKAGLFTIRLQTTGDYQIPAHQHVASEHVTVLSGTAHLGMGATSGAGTEMKAGDYAVLPANLPHYARFTGPTVVQITTMGPFGMEYSNAAEDPRKPKP